MIPDATEDVPPNGRLISGGLAAAGAFLMALNHFSAGSQNTMSLMALCLGPLALFLGIGGVVEPKIMWSLGKYGTHLPLTYKILGGVLGAVGVATTLFLLFFVYRLGPSP